jgi:hypothetical protein
MTKKNTGRKPRRMTEENVDKVMEKKTQKEIKR